MVKAPSVLLVVMVPVKSVRRRQKIIWQQSGSIPAFPEKKNTPASSVSRQPVRTREISDRGAQVLDSVASSLGEVGGAKSPRGPATSPFVNEETILGRKSRLDSLCLLFNLFPSFGVHGHFSNCRTNNQ